jgi:hypothetical protein
MKKIILFAGVAMLAACSQSEAPDAEPEAATVEEAAPAGPMPGKYTVANSDGSTVMMEIGEGNTFTVTQEDGTVVTGTYTVDGDKACFSADGSEEPPICNTGSAPDENGVVTVTHEDGSTATVTPVVEEAAEEAPAE